MVTCRRSRLAAFLILVSASLVWGAGKPEDSSEITLRGEIVDLACYIGHGAKGPDHQKCAEKCAEMGQPLGLLTSDGKLYVLLADHQNRSGFLDAKKLAGEQVELTGEPSERNGVAGFTVHAAKK
jgi:hypothetical protein